MPETTFDAKESPDGSAGAMAQDSGGDQAFGGSAGWAGAAGTGTGGASGGGDSGGPDAAEGSAGCDPGWIDCDGKPGCEVNAAVDPLHCGTCGTKCPSPPNSAATCPDAACSYQCQGDYADCNGSASDGCEVDTAIDEMNCGACGFACSLPNASVTCVAGQCTIAQCEPGYAACDTNVANGCEASLLSDPAHCGACDHTCPGGDNADSVCSGGSCGLACKPGWADCDANQANGCEAAKKDYAAAVLADAPVAYWRLGEKAESVATDATGHGHDGVYAGGHLGVAGAITCDPNGAASFDPSANSHVTIPRHAALESSTALTVELWFRQTGAVISYQKMLWYGDPAKSPWGSWGIERQGTQSTTFTFYVATSPDPEWLDVPNLTVNSWHHLVFSFDGAVMRGYVNGAFVVSYPNTGTIDYDKVHGMVIGAGKSGFDLFSGELDEVAVYDKVLSPARILAHYQAGHP